MWIIRVEKTFLCRQLAKYIIRVPSCLILGKEEWVNKRANRTSLYVRRTIQTHTHICKRGYTHH